MVLSVVTNWLKPVKEAGHPDEASFARLLAEWRKASPAARQRFLDHVGDDQGIELLEAAA